MVTSFRDCEPEEILVDQLEIQQFSRALLQEIRDAANRMTYASRTVGATPWRGSTVEETLWVEFARVADCLDAVLMRRELEDK